MGHSLSLRVGIAGGSGYGAAELLRLLLSHPRVELTVVTSREQAGRPVTEIHPQLRGCTNLAFASAEPALLAREADAVFLALPHGAAAELAHALMALRDDLIIIDLSGDHRLADASQYQRCYGRVHPHPENLQAFIYGSCETQRARLAGARRIANPGCFATGAILALAPLAAAGLLPDGAVVQGVTGSSGSGAEPKPGTHHPERHDNFYAYRPLRHQHLPEIRRALGARIHFVTHSAPLVRGIHTTAVLPWDGANDAAALYADYYAAAPFVRLVPEPPKLGAVRYTNYVDIHLTQEDGALCVLTALDNLVKGMAGQAVQNLNISQGWDETTGLRQLGFRV